MAKIMIADDSHFLCKLLAKIIEDEGHETVITFSGDEVLEKYDSVKPDIIFLDILMPGIKGHDTLEKLIAMDENAKVVICSSLGDQPDVKKEVKKLGAKAVIGKPIDVKEVKRAIDRCFR